MESENNKTTSKWRPSTIRFVLIGAASIILLAIGAAQLESFGYQFGQWLYHVTH